MKGGDLEQRQPGTRVGLARADRSTGAEDESIGRNHGGSQIKIDIDIDMGKYYISVN